MLLGGPLSPVYFHNANLISLVCFFNRWIGRLINLLLLFFKRKVQAGTGTVLMRVVIKTVTLQYIVRHRVDGLLLEFITNNIARTAPPKTHYFALAIACASSSQNVTSLQVTSYLGLDHIQNIHTKQ